MKKISIVLLLLSVIFKLSAQIKIECDDVKLAKNPLYEVTYVKAIETRIGEKFEACEFKLRNQPMVSTNIHPVVASLQYAYSDHRPISISPDMIWLLILQGFSNHINNNIEELRNKLVKFDGKKKLVIQTLSISDEFKKGSIKSPWTLVFPLMADSISKYVKSDIHSLFAQSFSTSTPVEKVAFEVAIFDAMSGYFDYEYQTSCGIPIIYIEGTTADWIKIKEKLKKFKGYHIDNWVKSLEPIIQQFVNASKNKIDHSFWSNIFKRVDESGGPYITGWFIKFFPYISSDKDRMIKNPYIDKEPKDFMEGLTTNQFNSGLSKFDFIWDYYDKKYEMEFMSGFIGIKQDKKSLTLRPEIGWLVKDKKINKTKKDSKDQKSLELKSKKDVEKINNSDYSLWGKLLFLSFSVSLIGLIIFKLYKKKK